MPRPARRSRAHESVLSRLDAILCESNTAHPLKVSEDDNGNHTYEWRQPGKDGTLHHYVAWFDRTPTGNRYDTGFGIVDPKTGHLDTHAKGHGVDVSDVGATYAKALRHHITNALPARHGTLRTVHYQYTPVPDTEGENAGIPHAGKRAGYYRRLWRSRHFGGNEHAGPHPLLVGAKVGYREEDSKTAVLEVAFPKGLHQHLKNGRETL